MAYQIRKIDPLDLQPRKAIGVNIPFSGKAVFNSTYSTKDAIRANLINFFLTGTGERVFRPTFGSGLRNLFFRNISINEITGAKLKIEDSLRGYFPKVVVNELEIQADPDLNTLNLYLKYSIRETNIEDEISINIET